MKLKRISEASMQEIVKAFSEYQYEAQEEGLYYLCKGKSGTEAYMKGFALAGIKSGWLHTISEKEEACQGEESRQAKKEGLQGDRKSTRLNSSHDRQSRMPSSA